MSESEKCPKCGAVLVELVSQDADSFDDFALECVRDGCDYRLSGSDLRRQLASANELAERAEARLAKLTELANADADLRDTGPVTPDSARESLCRYINLQFNKPEERPRATIPADPNRDDDVRLGAFIRQSEVGMAAMGHQIMVVTADRDRLHDQALSLTANNAAATRRFRKLRDWVRMARVQWEREWESEAAANAAGFAEGEKAGNERAEKAEGETRGATAWLIKCNTCSGQGWTVEGPQTDPEQVQCQDCMGTGWLPNEELLPALKDYDQIRADRDRLAGEVERMRAELLRLAEVVCPDDAVSIERTLEQAAEMSRNEIQLCLSTLWDCRAAATAKVEGEAQ